MKCRSVPGCRPNWNDHIEYVRKKCFAGLGKLKRWSGVLPYRTKKQIYNALVLPYLDYCSVVWQESQCLRQKLERVQNYGMRIILSRPPRTHSDDLRKELNWTTLEARRNMNRLCLVYKCVRSQVPTTSSSRFEANKGRTNGSMHLYQRGANTNFFKNSFTFKGTQDWNNLTKECRLLTSICSFKNKLRSLFKKFYPSLAYVFSTFVISLFLFTLVHNVLCTFLLLCIHSILLNVLRRTPR